MSEPVTCVGSAFHFGFKTSGLTGERPDWVFKGTRLPVATVIENLEDLSVDEVIEQFDVTREQVMAVLEFVAESLRADRKIVRTALTSSSPASHLST